MKKTWLVFKNEFLSVVATRSFILTLILIPLIGYIVILVVSNLQKENPTSSNPLSELVSPPVNNLPEGFVDKSGIIKIIPKENQKQLIRYADETEAAQGLRIGEVSAYYVVQPDYLQTGKVVYTRPDFNPLAGLTQSQTIRNVLEYNLLNGDEQLVSRLHTPLNITTESVNKQPVRDPGNMLTFFLPYGVTFLFYIMILGSASLLLSSVATEKQNRMMEILMTSVTPMQMLVGKIIALGLAGLLQTVVWSGAGFVLLRLSGQAFDIPAAFQLPVSILFWGVVFFLFGYALYGSLMAGVGALVPNLKESSQATTVVMIPMIIPLMLIGALINDPNGTLAVALSLFPLTAPVVMMTRLSASTVPWWELLLSVVLLVGMTYLVVRSVARMFRAQNLLSGNAFSMKVLFRELFGRN